MGMSARQIAGIASHYARAKWRWAHLRGDALRAYQDQRAQAVVAYAVAHAPFYRDHWAGWDLHDWRTLPTTDKRLMMDNFARFNTRGITPADALAVALRAEQSRDFAPTIGGLTVGLSSGTSGHRGIFLAAPWEQAGWAGILLARALHGWRGRLRVAFFLRANSNLYEQIGGLLIQFRYFDLMTPLPEAVAALTTFQPDVIVGPPSLLVLLAQACTLGTLRIRPTRLIAVAEVLEPQDHDHLHAVFGVPIHQIYQCTEGLLAVSCAHGALHIQEDLVAIQGEPVASGATVGGANTEKNGNTARTENIRKNTEESQTSPAVKEDDAIFSVALRDSSVSSVFPSPSTWPRISPIVTDLWRRTQPIIRYRLNDVLQLDPQPCACGSGFRVIRAVEGRSDDCCRFFSMDGGTRLFFPDTIRRMILLASAAIADYQAVQTQPGQLTIHLVVVPGTDFGTVAAAVRASAHAIMASYACRPAALTITEGLDATVPGAKRRRVRCLA